MSIAIEKASITDAKEILILQKLAYRSEAEIYNDFGIEPLVQTLDEFKKQFVDHVILRAVLGGTTIGSVRAYEKKGTCFIGKLIVHPNHQNKGVGKKLMAAIENLFPSSRYELFTGNRSEKNIALYEKLGYRIFKSLAVAPNFSLVYLEKKNPKKETYSFGDSDVAAERLNLVEKMFGPTSRSFIRDMVKRQPELAIDLGCGPGNTTKMIADETKSKKVIGMDVSISHLNRAKSKSDFNFVKHDVTKVPFPCEPSDVMYSRFLLSHLSSPLDCMFRWIGELKPGGLLLCEEDEWMQSNHSTIQTYINLVVELIGHNGGDLYVGKRFGEVKDSSKVKIKCNKVERFCPPTDLVARNFALNFAVWRNQKYIVENYRQDFLDEIAEVLDELSINPDKTFIEWGLHQIAIEKIG